MDYLWETAHRASDAWKDIVMRLRHFLTVAATAAVSLAGPASAFIAQNSLLVVPEGPRTFNVPFRGTSGNSDFWCAAGDYVIRGLGLRGGTRVFRLSEPPRRSGDGIRFSLDGAGAASSTGLVVFSSGPAGSVSASLAQGLCPSRMVRRDDR